eukprot:4406200-Amphidinium_carterae.1
MNFLPIHHVVHGPGKKLVRLGIPSSELAGAKLIDESGRPFKWDLARGKRGIVEELQLVVSKRRRYEECP